jgi:hypothetical protein
MKDPYKGRRGPTQRVLREATRQPDGKLPKAMKGGIGDVRDPHLTGKGSPWSAGHNVKKK